MNKKRPILHSPKLVTNNTKMITEGRSFRIYHFQLCLRNTHNKVLPLEKLCWCWYLCTLKPSKLEGLWVVHYVSIIFPQLYSSKIWGNDWFCQNSRFQSHLSCALWLNILSVVWIVHMVSKLGDVDFVVTWPNRETWTSGHVTKLGSSGFLITCKI